VNRESKGVKVPEAIKDLFWRSGSDFPSLAMLVLRAGNRTVLSLTTMGGMVERCIQTIFTVPPVTFQEIVGTSCMSLWCHMPTCRQCNTMTQADLAPDAWWFNSC